jgi:signal transduction histidine kinase
MKRVLTVPEEAPESLDALRAELEERLRFETFLAETSALFVNIPSDRIDGEIETAQRRMCEFLGLDRSALWLVPESGPGPMQLTHIYQAQGSPQIQGRLSPWDLFPWTVEKVQAGETVAIGTMADLPPGAGRDRESYSRFGTRATVVCPLAVGGGPVFGALSFAVTRTERDWPEPVVKGFQLIAQVFANALGRKVAEAALRESGRILRQNEHDLRRLAGRLIDAHEEERSRIARELHDDLAQRLAVLAIEVGALEKRRVDPADPVTEELREIKKGIVGLSQDVHSLSRQLHPSILDDLGLIKAVESECAGVSKREGLEVVFRHESMPRVIPQDVSLHLYRIVQEGLRNISKHACAEHVSVSLRGLDREVLLSIEDDGIGFDGAEARERPGLGFLSMRERARLIHGDLAIQSRPERGTVITLRAPLAGRENG